jgi:hypothetical protein
MMHFLTSGEFTDDRLDQSIRLIMVLLPDLLDPPDLICRFLY